jgi:serine/threonine protein kinase
MTPGTRLGPFEILSRIGAGGMGQVWKARDTRLDRIVAVKTSAEKFSERFETEARAVAALNHPHICTLHDVGPNYLVMEYVEGQEIKGPMPLDQTLTYAIQLASALEAAHRKGITHRDLKPANILVTKAGIKVLDFGLAKIEQAKAAVAADEALTRAALTQEGSIIGTLQYMAPEQLQGKAIDTRADIFSFGCVLYEMLTGKRAFDGANSASVIAAILERPAPSVGNVAPAALDRLLKRCLAKNPDDRWQSAGDLRFELEWIASDGTEVRGQA